MRGLVPWLVRVDICANRFGSLFVCFLLLFPCLSFAPPTTGVSITVTNRGPCAYDMTQLRYEIAEPDETLTGSGAGSLAAGSHTVLVDASQGGDPETWDVNVNGPMAGYYWSVSGVRSFTINVLSFEGTGACANQCLENVPYLVQETRGWQSYLAWALNGVTIGRTMLAPNESKFVNIPLWCPGDSFGYVTTVLPYTNIYGDGIPSPMFSNLMNSGATVSDAILTNQVAWGTDGTNLALEGTLKANVGAVVLGAKITDEGFNRVVETIRQWSNSVNYYTSTNVLYAVLTNDYAALTNYFKTTAIDSNAFDAIDGLLTLKWTNVVHSAETAIRNAGTNPYGWLQSEAATKLPATPTFGDDGDFVLDIELGAGGHYRIDSAELPGRTYFPICKGICRWLLYALFLVAIFKSAFVTVTAPDGSMSTVSTLPGPFGWSYKLFKLGAGLAALTGVTAIVSAVVGPALSDAASAMAANVGAWGEAAGVGWKIANFVLPVDTMVEVWIAWVVFEYGVMKPLAGLVRWRLAGI